MVVGVIVKDVDMFEFNVDGEVEFVRAFLEERVGLGSFFVMYFLLLVISYLELFRSRREILVRCGYGGWGEDWE